jgi:hypothetical protein
VVILQRETGAATVEFVFLTVAMFLPFSWLIASAFSLHSAALALDDAARQGARAFSLAETPAAAEAAGVHLANLVLSEHQLINSESRVRFTCVPSCLQPQSVVRAEVGARVALPWVPPNLGLPAEIGLSASHVEQIDFYRNTP